jgi:hypothetical protein
MRRGTIAVARHASTWPTFPFEFPAGALFHVLKQEGQIVWMQAVESPEAEFQCNLETANFHFDMPVRRTAWDWLNEGDALGTVVSIRAAGVNVRTPMIISAPKLERLDGLAPSGRTAWQWLSEE